MALIAAHHNAGSFWWWHCSDSYIISLPPPHSKPPLPPRPISLMVYVKVKHHVYLLTYLHFPLLPLPNNTWFLWTLSTKAMFTVPLSSSLRLALTGRWDRLWAAVWNGWIRPKAGRQNNLYNTIALLCVAREPFPNLASKAWRLPVKRATLSILIIFPSSLPAVY